MRELLRKFSVPLLLSTVMLTVLSFSLTAKAAEGEKKEVTHLFGNHECPISGDAVDPAYYAEYKDEENHVYGRVYVCCGGCKKKADGKVEELYKKHYRTDAKTGKEIEPVKLGNKECPVSGAEVSEAGTIEYNGIVVGHCCNNCSAKFLEDPDTHLAKLADDEMKAKYELK